MNEQIFKLNTAVPEFENSHIYANYELEGETKHLYIPFEVFLSHLNNAYPKQCFLALSGDMIEVPKFDKEDLETLPKEAIEEHVRAYLYKELRIALILENRKLKRRLQRVEISTKCLQVAVDHLSEIKQEADRVIQTKADNAKYWRSVAESTMCKLAIGFFDDAIKWQTEKILLK